MVSEFQRPNSVGALRVRVGGRAVHIVAEPPGLAGTSTRRLKVVVASIADAADTLQWSCAGGRRVPRVPSPRLGSIRAPPKRRKVRSAVAPIPGPVKPEQIAERAICTGHQVWKPGAVRVDELAIDEERKVLGTRVELPGVVAVRVALQARGKGKARGREERVRVARLRAICEQVRGRCRRSRGFGDGCASG